MKEEKKYNSVFIDFDGIVVGNKSTDEYDIDFEKLVIEAKKKVRNKKIDKLLNEK